MYTNTNTQYDNLHNEIIELYNEIQNNEFEYINTNLLSLNKKFHNYNIEIISNLNLIKFELEKESNIFYLSLKEKGEKITEKHLSSLIENDPKILQLNILKIKLENSFLYLKAIRELLNLFDLQFKNN